MAGSWHPCPVHLPFHPFLCAVAWNTDVTILDYEDEEHSLGMAFWNFELEEVWSLVDPIEKSILPPD
jgi:hypothetical protein